ncbi:hypothetical protein HPB50_019691 [Hyalomma asiaticum]|uniref:Uncharacterized protein n=1 Tax=Hyalomma asiaticum TaxID=266040 RepID=A0ACB7SAU1_HYAAI|nr:hypothetical protein HPB50_019691 [Hyalomma asiaticum]
MLAAARMPTPREVVKNRLAHAAFRPKETSLGSSSDDTQAADDVGLAQDAATAAAWEALEEAGIIPENVVLSDYVNANADVIVYEELSDAEILKSARAATADSSDDEEVGHDVPKAVQCSDQLMQKIQAQNRRSLDLLASKCYFYHSRCYELTDRMSDIRSFLHSRLRTATLRSDYEGQAVLVNCLLRNYLHYNLYEQASKLVSKSAFPEAASNNEWARYLYYLGRIRAIQLDYSEARRHLLQAIRKAPQHAALGFKQTVHKLAITVDLLLGDIPDRSIFRQAPLRRTLAPYFQLTQAVRAGNLGRFGEVLEHFGAKFQADHTFTLIIRLRHNVIKTGVRMINLSYLRISLADVAHKLQLDSPEDAEFIVAKAIRDGVIEATIDHERGCMQSKENMDIYCTREPQAAFHQRICFCLDIHNQSVKVRDVTVDDEEILISFDVKSLFTCVPVDLAVEVCEAALQMDDKVWDRSPIDAPDLLKLLRFCLKNTYFVIQNVVYKQLYL